MVMDAILKIKILTLACKFSKITSKLRSKDDNNLNSSQSHNSKRAVIHFTQYVVYVS